MIANEVRCPYCGNKPQKVLGDRIFPQRRKLWRRKYLLCAPCDAWVGCHDLPGHKFKPFGTLANRHTRIMRLKAHEALDPIWQEGLLVRTDAYAMLARALGIRIEDTHIGMFDARTCRTVISICNKYRKQHTPKEENSGQREED